MQAMPPRILVGDDNETFRTVTAALLEPAAPGAGRVNAPAVHSAHATFAKLVGLAWAEWLVGASFKQLAPLEDRHIDPDIWATGLRKRHS